MSRSASSLTAGRHARQRRQDAGNQLAGRIALAVLGAAKRAALAEELGIGEPTLHDILTGARPLPARAFLALLRDPATRPRLLGELAQLEAGR